jgi:hypothetical protein
MFVEFQSLPDTARVWIYQASRKFSEAEKSTIFHTLQTFTNQWQAHGHPLKSSFVLMHDQFIVLAADESFNEASGCSIDSSVNVIRQLDKQLALDLFDRTNVAFHADGKVVLVKLNELSKALAEGKWSGNSLVFNNAITKKAELATHWLSLAGNTWLKRYLTKIAVSS